MTGSKTLSASIDIELVEPIQAAPRNQLNSNNYQYMKSDLNKDQVTNNRHNYTNSKIIGLAGCIVVGYIIYKLIINYSGLI